MHRKILLTLPLISLSTGCFVFQPQHKELEEQVYELRNKVAERDKELEEVLAKANEQLAEVEAKLAEAETLLRGNQASLGVRVENLEGDLQTVRGQAEDSLNEVAAISANVAESLTDIDGRLKSIETKIQAETDIPEGKTDLLKEAERSLNGKDYARARRLFRTYLSRYPGDPKEAEVRFKIGLTLFSERDYRSALGEFYWLVQNAPDSAVIHDAVYYSGLAFAKLGQCDKAIAYFQALTKKDSGAPDNYKKQAEKQIETLQKDDGKICTDRARPDGEGSTEAEPAVEATKKKS